MTGWLEHALHSMGPWSIFVAAFIGPYLFPAAGELAIIAAVGLKVGWPEVFLLGVTGSIASDQLAYWIGELGGSKVAVRLLTVERRQRLERRMHHHAVRALIAGRMVPGARTWIALLCGVAHYPWRRFSALNLAGCVIWTVVFLAIGAVFGATADVQGVVEWVIKWAFPLLVVIVLAMFARALLQRPPHDVGTDPLP